MKKCIVYHGLNSKPSLSRTKMLNSFGYDVLAQYFNYHNEWNKDKGKSLFARELVKASKTDLILGISFGGYLAYQLSKATGADLLLINPAIDRKKSKSVIKDFDIENFNKTSNIEIFSGSLDTVVPVKNAELYLKEKGEKYDLSIIDGMGHRTPNKTFLEILKNSKLING